MSDPKCRWQCPEDWSEWSQWLAAGLHARNRWRLPVLLVGILFSHGRRSVTPWLRAAGVSLDYQDYYYFLAALGGKTKTVATALLLLVLRTLPLPDRLLAVLVEWIAPIVKQAGKTLWIVVDGGYPSFSTDPNATAVEIIEAFADRATIEQDFHDVKEVWGAGQQQVRNIWCNLAVYHLNLWMHTLVELWSWNALTTGFATAAVRRGTTPTAVRLMPIAAKPCGDKSSSTNYRRLPPSGVCLGKSSSSPNA